MANAELIEKIRKTLAEEFEIDAELIQPEAPLMKTLELDSLDLVDMVVLIEHNFGFTLKAPRFRRHQNLSGFLRFYRIPGE